MNPLFGKPIWETALIEIPFCAQTIPIRMSFTPEKIASWWHRVFVSWQANLLQPARAGELIYQKNIAPLERISCLSFLEIKIPVFNERIYALSAVNFPFLRERFYDPVHRICIRHGCYLCQILRNTGYTEMLRIRWRIVYTGAEPVLFPGEPLDILIQ